MQLLNVQRFKMKVKDPKESLLLDSLLTSHSGGNSDSIKSDFDISKRRHYFHSQGTYQAVPSYCEEEHIPQVRVSGYELKHTCQMSENLQGMNKTLPTLSNQKVSIQMF